MISFLKKLLNISDPNEDDQIGAHLYKVPTHVIADKLSHLGVNPLDFRHDDFDSNFIDIDLSEELRGVSHKSKTFCYDSENDYMMSILFDYTNGDKEIVITYTNLTERKIKVIVDKYYSYFGEDTFYAKEYTKRDYMRKDKVQSVRWWRFNKFELKVFNPEIKTVIITCRHGLEIR